MRADVAASVSKRAAGPRRRTALLALLALAALVLSVLAMHSAASSHVMGIPLPVSSSHSAEHELAAAHAGTAQASSAAAHQTAMAAAQNVGVAVADSASITHTPTGTALASTAMTTAIVATTMAAITATTVTMAASHDGMLDCSLMVMACVMLLVLAGIVLSRRPARVQRPGAAGQSLIGRVFLVDPPVHRPRLTVLCISRV